MKTMVYIGCMKESTNRKKSDIGKRLTSFRKQAGLSQAQLARAVDLPQRTIANHETIANYIPSTVLPDLANVLGITIEQLLGVGPENKSTRGPKPRLEKQIDAIRRLPKKDQVLAVQLIDRLLKTAN